MIATAEFTQGAIALVTVVDEERFPVILSPTGREASVDELASWLARSEASLARWLAGRGAVLFRGFNVVDPKGFGEVARAAIGNLGKYVGGDAPRSAVAEQVYDATSFAPTQDLPLHNELSYSGTWPTRLAFCGLVPAPRGGQTTVASGRKIYGLISPPVRERFAALGVTYLQHLRDEEVEGGGKSWQETFETGSRAAVEKICSLQGITFEWTALGLRTSRTNPGVRIDHRSGHRYWFNQADLWHAEFDDLKDRAQQSRRIDLSSQLGSHALFGDGSEIPVEFLGEIRGVYARCEVPIDWRTGDVLVINNETVLHGRRAYEGNRKVLVTMNQFGIE